MIVLEWLLNIVALCNAAGPWQLGSQDAATPMIQGIIDLHDDIPFFLILILWVMGFGFFIHKMNKEEGDNLLVGGSSSSSSSSKRKRKKEKEKEREKELRESMERKIMDSLNSYLSRFEAEIEVRFPFLSQGELWTNNFQQKMLKEVLSHYSPDTLKERDLKTITRVLNSEMEYTATYTNNLLYDALGVVAQSYRE